MANNHKLLKVQAPVPSLTTGYKGLQFTVYNPDTNTFAVNHAEVAEEDWSNPAKWEQAMCDVDEFMEFCP